MSTEKRIIKASYMTGFTDIVIGLIMYASGWSNWYFDHFHTFGILGIGMLSYGYWHNYFYCKETGVNVWSTK